MKLRQIIKELLQYLRFKPYRELRISLSIAFTNQLYNYFNTLSNSNARLKINKGMIYGEIGKQVMYIDMLDSPDHQEFYEYYSRKIIGEFIIVNRLHHLDETNDMGIFNDVELKLLDIKDKSFTLINRVMMKIAYNGAIFIIYDKHGRAVVYSLDCIYNKLIKKH